MTEKSGNNKGEEEDIIEEFDEKVKIISQSEDDHLQQDEQQ